jgi:hypothetical protein
MIRVDVTTKMGAMFNTPITELADHAAAAPAQSTSRIPIEHGLSA